MNFNSREINEKKKRSNINYIYTIDKFKLFENTSPSRKYNDLPTAQFLSQYIIFLTSLPSSFGI